MWSSLTSRMELRIYTSTPLRSKESLPEDSSTLLISSKTICTSLEEAMRSTGSTTSICSISVIYALNLETLQWTKCETKGTPPAGRLQHSAVAYGSKIFIFGG